MKYKFKVVKSTRTNERFMQMNDTLHRFKEKKYNLPPVYGPYNTIKKPAVNAVFYNVSKHVVQLDDPVVELPIEVNPKHVTIGFDF